MIFPARNLHLPWIFHSFLGSKLQSTVRRPNEVSGQSDDRLPGVVLHALGPAGDGFCDFCIGIHQDVLEIPQDFFLIYIYNVYI